MFWLLLACSGRSEDDSETWNHGLCKGQEIPSLAAPVEDCSGDSCLVAEGEFLMGNCHHTEMVYPMRAVYLPSFRMDRTEVSIEAWKSCEQAGGCSDLAERCQVDIDLQIQSHPISCVTWSQAGEYCSWKKGRLPSEAEWEKAARGTDAREYPWGISKPTCAQGNANFFESESGSISRCEEATVPVDALSEGRSPYGILNMAGNVLEWVEDDFDVRYYQRSEVNDPRSPTDGCYLLQDGWKGICPYKVLRGGGFDAKDNSVRTYIRFFGRPDVRDHNIGFRCAYDI